jgi:hypothetical protein
MESTSYGDITHQQNTINFRQSWKQDDKTDSSIIL